MISLRTHPSPHPFVRKGLVAERPPGLASPALVGAVDPVGEHLGEGFWNERSDIAWRRLTRADEVFDEAALVAAIDRAARLREALPGVAEGDACRVVHAEGDGLSGLIVDRYKDVLVLQFHSAGWLLLEQPLLAALHARLGTRHHRVILDERTARLEGVRPREVLSQGVPERLRISEHGVRYQVDFSSGHKTGFFLDQRENRLLLTSLVQDATVLDACCYSGGFGLAALVAGGAAEVTGVDLDEGALALAKSNAKLNQVRAKYVHADAFDWMRQMGGQGRQFDVVVLDPPKLVAGKRDEFDGRRRYADLNRLAMDVVAPGGLLLTCSCSGALQRGEFLELVRTAARKAGRDATILADPGAAADHPVSLECPESEYLKTLWLRLT
ncbi:MAG: class I SAM-dependent rRNA methyltransferase [Planctomycetota bacterium]|nr:MAG: class I SAM-dependent rRNA methyltransferase [Planctomycetota bacterium]